MFAARFWKRTVERAVKSAAQALIGMWTLDGTGVLSADYKLAAGVALGAAVLSILTSIVSSGIGQSDDPSVVNGGGK
jgi:hypothetical protein